MLNEIRHNNSNQEKINLIYITLLSQHQINNNKTACVQQKQNYIS